MGITSMDKPSKYMKILMAYDLCRTNKHSLFYLTWPKVRFSSFVVRKLLHKSFLKLHGHTHHSGLLLKKCVHDGSPPTN